MEKLMNVIRTHFKPIAAVLVLALLFSACKKNDGNFVRTPAAGLMAFNLAPDKSAIGYTLSGNQLSNAALGYTSYTGSYLPIYLGDREVRAYDYTNGSTLAIANGNFRDSMYYSVFFTGANGSYRTIVVKDELDSLTAQTGKAWVRYINAIPDSTSAIPVVKIGEDAVIDETAPYGTVSSFKAVTAGNVNTSISNYLNITAGRNITLEENKIYTVLFVGLPVRTDSSQAMQVKFIQNGTITP